MSELSKLLGTAAPPHQINHEGRVFTFHLLDQPRKSALEKRLYQQAREAVYVDRDHMTSEEYLLRLDKVREAYEANEYSWYGPRSQKSLSTAKGAMMLLETITGETEDDLTPLLLARAEEVKTLITTVLNESFKKVKSKPAEEKAGG